MIPKKIQNDIDYYQEMVDKMREACIVTPTEVIEDLIPEGVWSSNVCGELQYVLPYKFDLIVHVKQVMKVFEPHIVLHHENNFIWDESASAGLFLYYRTEGMYEHDFTIAFRSGVEGSTCVLNPIGERTIPIFEVTCEKGAAEGTFNGD